MSPAEPRRKVLEVRLSEGELGHLKAAAKDLGRPVSEVVRERLRGLTGPENAGGRAGRPREAVVVSEPRAPVRELPAAGWIVRRSGGEVSLAKAAAALRAGNVEWRGEKIVVNGEEF